MFYFLASMLLVSVPHAAVPTPMHPMELALAPLPSSHLVSKIQAETPTAYYVQYTYDNVDCSGDPRKAFGSGFNVCYISVDTPGTSYITRPLNETDGTLYYEYTTYNSLDCSGDMWYSNTQSRVMHSCDDGFKSVYEESANPWLDIENGLTFLYHSTVEVCESSAPPSTYLWYQLDVCQQTWRYTACTAEEFSAITYSQSSCSGSEVESSTPARYCEVIYNYDSQGNVYSTSIISDVCT